MVDEPTKDGAGDPKGIPTIEQLYDSVWDEIFNPPALEGRGFRKMILRTTCGEFELWMTQATRKLGPATIRTKRGIVTLSPARCEIIGGGAIQFTVLGTYEWRTGQYKAKTAVPGASTELYRYKVCSSEWLINSLGQLIVLIVRPLAGWRVALEARCFAVAALAEFEALLADIRSHFAVQIEELPRVSRSDLPGERARENEAISDVAQHNEVRKQSNTELLKMQGRGGRPQNPDDHWAWVEVNVKHRERRVVFNEWLARIGERGLLLADARDSFKKATKKGKKGGRNHPRGE